MFILYLRLLALPVGAIIISIIAMMNPSMLQNLGFVILPLLGLVMFCMGMTLRTEDFVNVVKRPRLIAIGITLQFVLMPFIAWFLAQLFDLDQMIVVGLILVGACPGGTASNVICYLSRGDTALSISLTAGSTILAIFLTPLITEVYVGQSINVPVYAMINQLVVIILLPVMCGVLINRYFHHVISQYQFIFPSISVISIVLIIGVIVAKTQTLLMQSGLLILVVVIMHNSLGLISGYWIPRLMGFDKRICRTLSIEVGMQNSGLGVVLAEQFFTSAASISGAIFSLWHNISGAVMSVMWSRKKESNE